MKLFYKIFALILLFHFTSCSDELADTTPSDSKSGSSTSSIENGSGNNTNSGLVTAAEWNDLNNWNFWDSIPQIDYMKDYAKNWDILAKNRISVQLINNDSLPIHSETVRLIKNGQVIQSTVTDNLGKAEFFIDFNNISPQQLNWSNYILETNSATDSTVTPYSTAINTIKQSNFNNNQAIEIAFVVDATGSMGDELEYLKNELLDVLNRVTAQNPNSSVKTSSIFYRDEGDQYVTKVSQFTTNSLETVEFIQAQSANGGGDFPEAVHTALDLATSQLQWTENAKTKLIFLLLDAPPHRTNSVKNSINQSIIRSLEKGIKIIPITASGINKETEFLMRNYSIITNGTYVFITNDSGIGNDHLQATVGNYTVEYLNDLMVRLVQKYSE